MILDSLKGYNVVRCLKGSVVAFALLLAHTDYAAAHDIPSDITVHAIVRPEGERLQFLLRVPLRAMRDIDFPETAQGYLDIERLAPQLPDAATVWLADFVRIYEGQQLLRRPRVAATQISLPSDKSFASFDQALHHVLRPKLPQSANVFWGQVFFDVLFEYPIESAHSRFAIHTRLEHLAARVVSVVRFVTPDGVERDFEFQGDAGIVPLDPSWLEAAWRFVELGFFHILDGTDHLLFLFCLAIPLRRIRPLLAVITAFTAAHSMTLIASALGLAPDALWFPPLIETLIAASIVYMALENIVSTNVRHRWMIAFGFGLVHGFGFSFALREMLQFAGSHLLVSLLSFNIGVEFGQLLVLALLIPLLHVLFRFVMAERVGAIVLSALVAHTGWHWMVDRAEQLRRFRFEWPLLNAASMATAVRWLMVTWIVAGVVWALFRFTKRHAGGGYNDVQERSTLTRSVFPATSVSRNSRP